MPSIEVMTPEPLTATWMVSLPPVPDTARVSVSAPPLIVSTPSPTVYWIRSLPAPPLMVSLPSPPVSVLLPLLPLMTLASPLPVTSMLLASSSVMLWTPVPSTSASPVAPAGAVTVRLSAKVVAAPE